MHLPAPLLLQPTPSRPLTLGILLFHAATLALPFTLPLDTALRLTLVLATLASLALTWHTTLVTRGPSAIRSALWRPDGIWEIEDGDGRRGEARLLSSARLGPRFVILRLEVGRWPPAVLLLTPGRIAPETLRRLRVRLGTQ